jgi:hypothetical protein
MPHPKNHMKLRGDIHPPEVEYDMAMSFDDAGEPRAFDDANLRMNDRPQASFVVLAIPEQESKADRMQALARRQVAARPALMALGAFVLGIVAMRMLKRGARGL